MTNLENLTLATIVAENSHSAVVMEKYRLDFCCKGKRTLAQACAEKGLPLQTITQELAELTASNGVKTMPFYAMTAEQLIGYILLQHHFYVKQIMPIIAAHLGKISTKHAERFPYMVQVEKLFQKLIGDMSKHMWKEETILFPRIKEIEAVSQSGGLSNADISFIAGPVNLMMEEHDHAGNLLSQIRELTHNYIIPEDACTTFRLTLNELKGFEEDLHKHVHLENHYLFPKALNFLNR